MATKTRFTDHDVLTDLTKRCKTSTQKDVARHLGFPPAFICDVLRQRRNVSERLAVAMGYRRFIEYERVRP